MSRIQIRLSLYISHHVDKIAIGFGDKDNPQQNSGDGTMYFDDIRLYRPEPDEPEAGIEPAP